MAGHNKTGRPGGVEKLLYDQLKDVTAKLQGFEDASKEQLAAAREDKDNEAVTELALSQLKTEKERKAKEEAKLALLWEPTWSNGYVKDSSFDSVIQWGGHFILGDVFQAHPAFRLVLLVWVALVSCYFLTFWTFLSTSYHEYRTYGDYMSWYATRSTQLLYALVLLVSVAFLLALWLYMKWGHRNVIWFLQMARQRGEDRTDRRCDSISVGDLRHGDAQYAWFRWRDRLLREQDLFVSMELLMQLLHYSNTCYDDPKIVLDKLRHVASRMQSVNIDKRDVLSGRDVISDTVFVAFAWYQQRRERESTRPFPISSA